MLPEESRLLFSTVFSLGSLIVVILVMEPATTVLSYGNY